MKDNPATINSDRSLCDESRVLVTLGEIGYCGTRLVTIGRWNLVFQFIYMSDLSSYDNGLVASSIERDYLSLAGEYAVASEICRRSFYAQITLGRLKRTDILVYDPQSKREVRIEVKTKHKKWWPGVKGIKGEQTLLVFVDFQGKGPLDRPDFYILTSSDWQDFLEKHVKGGKDLKRLIDGYIPEWKDGYKGQGVSPEMILEHKEKWDKLESLLASS